MEEQGKEKTNPESILPPEMGVNMVIDRQTIALLLGIGRDLTRTIYDALVEFCNKGPEYQPTNMDFANFMKWDVMEVILMRYCTRKEILAMGFEGLKKMWIRELKKQWLAEIKGLIITSNKDITEVILLDVSPDREEELLKSMVINGQGKLEILNNTVTNETLQNVIKNLKKQIE